MKVPLEKLREHLEKLPWLEPQKREKDRKRTRADR
jgi:hypothetical protein